MSNETERPEQVISNLKAQLRDSKLIIENWIGQTQQLREDLGAKDGEDVFALARGFKARVEELKIKIGMQQGLFNAAMDRCEKAETENLRLKIAMDKYSEDEVLCLTNRYRKALEQIRDRIHEHDENTWAMRIIAVEALKN